MRASSSLRGRGSFAAGVLILVSLCLVTLVAAAYRAWRLAVIPPGFHYDEAFEALEAWRVITQPGYHPIFFPGNFGVEPAFIYLTSIAFRLFGFSPIVMRGTAALIGTLTVPALYGLGRELVRADDRIPAALPWLAAASLAVMRWHVLFSRVGIEPILVPLCLVLLLWAFFHALRTDSWPAWTAFGLIAGLGSYTYLAGRLLPLLALCLAVPGLLATPRERLAHRLRGVLLAELVAAAVVAPLAWHFVQHPDQLLLRSSQVAYGDAGQNLLRTLGMFSLDGDADPRSNVPHLPALDPVLSPCFYLGLALTLWHLVRARQAGPAAARAAAGEVGEPELNAASTRVGVTPTVICASLVLASVIMLVPTVMSDHAPHFRRALGLTPLVALFAGMGLAFVWAAGRGLLRPRDPATGQGPETQHACGLAGLSLGRRLGVLVFPLLALALLGGSAAISARDYFQIWGNSRALFYAYDQGLWDIGQYVATLPSAQNTYLSPRPETDTTLAFAWRNGPRVRRFDGRYAFLLPSDASLAARDTTYVFIEHEDFRGAHVLRRLFPGAVETRTFRDRSGKVYARAFQVARGTLPASQPHYLLSADHAAAWSAPDIRLEGYDLDSTTHRPGEIFYLQLWWRAMLADGSRPRDWTVFVHLLGPKRGNGSPLWAGSDAQPGQGSVPLPSWAPGDRILDEYQLQVPSDAPPGRYEIELGLYNQANPSERAIMVGLGQRDHLTLTHVEVERVKISE